MKSSQKIAGENTNFAPGALTFISLTGITMKQWIAVLLLALPLCVTAQVPDNDKIEAEIHNASSPYYYPTLMARYREGDENLGREAYRHLYYGYLFNPGYNPLSSVPAMDSVVTILLRDPDLVLDDYRRLIQHGNTVLETDPFNPRILNIMTYAYGTIGDTENEVRSSRRFDGVMDAILSTGEGSVEKSPWHILWFSHAEDVMDFLGTQYRKPMVVSRTTEYFPLLKREGRVRGYYFDYSRIYVNRPEEPLTPPERRWQINNQVLD